MAGSASWRIRFFHAYTVQPHKESNERGMENNAASITKIMNSLLRYTDNGYMWWTARAVEEENKYTVSWYYAGVHGTEEQYKSQSVKPLNWPRHNHHHAPNLQTLNLSYGHKQLSLF